MEILKTCKFESCFETFRMYARETIQGKMSCVNCLKLKNLFSKQGKLFGVYPREISFRKSETYKIRKAEKWISKTSKTTWNIPSRNDGKIFICKISEIEKLYSKKAKPTQVPYNAVYKGGHKAGGGAGEGGGEGGW